MSSLSKIVAAHPLSAEMPYARIKFSCVGPHCTPLYKVGKGKREFSAANALRESLQRFGGVCFYCDVKLQPGKSAAECTRDHLRSRKEGGLDYLHNLVLACRRCNLEKGSRDLITFDAEDARKYLLALDAHLVSSMKQLSQA